MNAVSKVRKTQVLREKRGQRFPVWHSSVYRSSVDDASWSHRAANAVSLFFLGVRPSVAADLLPKEAICVVVGRRKVDERQASVAGPA